VNSSLTISDRFFLFGVLPNPSKFGGGISGEGWAPASSYSSSTVTPIFGDWGLFGFPSAIIIGGDPLGFLSEALLDGLLPLRLSVPSGFFGGALLDFAPVSLCDSLSARIRLTASSVSVPGSDMFLSAFDSANRLGVSSLLFFRLDLFLSECNILFENENRNSYFIFTTVFLQTQEFTN
jgi:hypothetical protein